MLDLLGELKIRVVSVEDDDEGVETPALCLYRPGHFGRSAMIPLASAYKFDEPDKQPPEIQAMTVASLANIAKALDYDVNGKLTAQLLMRIQDHLDDLIKAEPHIRKKKEVGEATVTMGDQKFTTIVEQ